MELGVFKKKYEAFQFYEDKLPGVALGLNVLRNLNILVNLTPKENKINELFVNFYDFESNSLKELSLTDLNLKLYDLYMYIVYLNRNINKNKLYSVICLVYEKTYKKYNYRYYDNDVHTMYDMINKFIQGLRKNLYINSLNKKADCYCFDLHKVITNFDQNFFDENVSAEQFYYFWVDFIHLLKDQSIIDLNLTEFSFKFKNECKFELINIMYFSFNLMTLGNNKIYDIYDLTSDNVEANLKKIYTDYNQRTLESKFYINDLLVSLVLSSCVSQVCAPKNINNIFIEAFNI